MKRLIASVLAGVSMVLAISALPRQAEAAEAPADRVVVMYFHRTERCDTCKKMGSYSEEAVKSGFAEQLKNRTVEFHYIDFQDRKNAAFVKGYRISGPALVVAKVVGNKVAGFKNLEGIWMEVVDKREFLKYVQENVAAYCR